MLRSAVQVPTVICWSRRVVYFSTMFPRLFCAI